jgi:hypothetical protein
MSRQACVSRYASTAIRASDIAPVVRRDQVIHINAEYSDQASDHDPQVLRMRP